jgi:uncharacterized protein YndB with AHSA1/START domain
MRPVTVTATIDAPRERVFDYLSDVANHVEFSDHYLGDFRLARLQSRGVGASASFRIGTRGARWGEVVITGLERPYRIELEGQAGRLGRIKTRAAYTLTPYGHDMTKVEYTLSTEPATRLDALREALGCRSWVKRKSRKALRRLASLLEEGRARAHAVRAAAG